MASVEVDGQKLCRKCAQKRRRIELKRQSVRRLVASKWPKHTHSVLVPGVPIDERSMNELVEALLPLLKAGYDDEKDGSRS